MVDRKLSHNETSYHYFSTLITKKKKIRSLNILKFLENFLHTLDLCLLCLWLVIQTATRCSTILLIKWLIGSVAR